MELYKSPVVPRELAAKLETNAARYWEHFYRHNQDRFFKDRHYFGREFPELLNAGTVLEVGCGVGNSVWPLLELNPSAAIYCCDFSPHAVALVRRHPQYAATGRVTAFVADITSTDLTATVPPSSVDVATMIFVLSAVAPDAMRSALRRVAATLRPGGKLLFRDYAAGDLAQERLAREGRQQQLGGNCYARPDGTLAYYFTQEELLPLFASEGFAVERSNLMERTAENRARKEVMERRFVQAVCTWQGGRPAAASAPQQMGEQPDSGSRGGGSSSGGGSSNGSAAQQMQQAEDEEHVQEVAVQLGGSQLRLSCRALAAASAEAAAAQALAALVLCCPAFFLNADVLDMCSWDAPLAALAALRWCRRTVAAGCNDACAALLRRNARRNGHLFIIERLRLHQLDWRAAASGMAAVRQQHQAAAAARQQQHQHQQQQDQQQQQQDQQQQHQQPQAEDQCPEMLLEQQGMLLRAFPAGFKAVLAAPPAAASAGELQRLLAAAAALLSRQTGSLVMLCVEEDAGVQQAVAGAAAAAGLQETALPAELAAAASAAAAAVVPHRLRLLALQLAG